MGLKQRKPLPALGKQRSSQAPSAKLICSGPEVILFQQSEKETPRFSPKPHANPARAALWLPHGSRHGLVLLRWPVPGWIHYGKFNQLEANLCTDPPCGLLSVSAAEPLLSAAALRQRRAHFLRREPTEKEESCTTWFSGVLAALD